MDFPLYAFRLTPQGHLQSVSPSWLRLTGYSQEQVLNSFWFNHLSPIDQYQQAAHWIRWQSSDQAIFESDLHFQLASGENLAVHLVLQRQPEGFQGYLTPLFEQQRQESYIRQLEARLDTVFRTSNQYIVILDLEHKVLDFNQTAAETARLRFHRELTRGECFTNYVQPDRMDDFYDSFQQVLQGRHVFKERVIYAADRQGYSYEMTYTPIYGEQGEITSICFMMLNVEHQRQIKQLLNQEQSFVTSILNSTNALLFVIDKHGQIVRFNKACERVTGYLSDEVQEQVFWDLFVVPEERERVAQLYQQISPHSQLNNIQYRLLDREGKGHFISWSLSMMPGMHEDNLLIVSTGIDVTERLEAQQALQESEAMLLQAQKMEAVGHLAGGIAHDFNNMLTAIMGYGELLEKSVSEDPLGRDYLSEILRTCLKARELTRQLLMFSRKAPAEAQPIQVNQVIQQMTRLIRQLLEDKVQLLIEPDPEAGWIQANAIHLEQLMMNLVVNARDAMDGQGVLTISLAQKKFSKDIHHPMFGNFSAGRYLCISVADTGCGMSEETRRQIFDPFFTTKERGKGTGLGLAVVYRIIKESQGWVEVSSLPGQGSTFEIYFPLLEQKALPPKAKRRGHLIMYGLPWQQHQAIHQVLSDLPFEFDSPGQKQDLQQLLEQERDSQLLITDLNLPRQHREVDFLEKYPSLKVLYIADDTQEDLSRIDELGPHEDVLLSPFSPHQLQARIQRMLNI